MSFNTKQTPTCLLALAGVLALADTCPPAVSRVPSPCSLPMGSPASSGWAPPPSSPPGLLHRRSVLPGYVEPEGWASPMSPLTLLPPSPRPVMPEATAVEEVMPEQAALVESIFIEDGMPDEDPLEAKVFGSVNSSQSSSTSVSPSLSSMERAADWESQHRALRKRYLLCPYPAHLGLKIMDVAAIARQGRVLGFSKTTDSRSLYHRGGIHRYERSRQTNLL
ncbi:hypothetical protein BDN72DRAFT_866451, partial [Pluteus cervinus]